jgi:hypothetical protein
MQLARFAQPFNREHLTALRRQRLDQARLDQLAVEDHRTGSAVARVAADLRTGDAQLVPQDFEQSGRDLGLHPVRLAVDVKL